MHHKQIRIIRAQFTWQLGLEIPPAMVSFPKGWCDWPIELEPVAGVDEIVACILRNDEESDKCSLRKVVSLLVMMQHMLRQ